MSKKQFAVTLIVAMISGLAGGIISNLFFVNQQTQAQTLSQPLKSVVAQEFILVDDKGKQRAILTDRPQFVNVPADDDQLPRLLMFDRAGNSRITLGSQKPFGPSLEIVGGQGTKALLQASPLRTSLQLDGLRSEQTVLVFVEDNDPNMRLFSGKKILRTARK